MWRIVPKPVDLDRLLTLVDEALNRPLVLLVDDDADLCANLWDLLWEQGFRISLAHNARVAADLLRDDGFKVVLIDMRFPDGNGADVLRTVRQMESQARTVLITGHRAELEPSLERLKDEGADALCYKPFDMDEQLSTVERLSRP